jgi:ATP:corrinoid adenosyltransferase
LNKEGIQRLPSKTRQISLDQRRSKNLEVNIMAGKGKGKGRSRFGFPSLVGLGLAIWTMASMGIFNAIDQLVKGNWTTAASNLVASFQSGAWLLPVAGAVGAKIARQAVGPVHLMKVGKYSIRAL